jgi:tetratricopeptide (TPR) repeat protein
LFALTKILGTSAMQGYFESISNSLAQIHTLYRLKNYDKALARLIQLRIKAPKDSRVWSGLARTLDKLGRYAESNQNWEHVKTLHFDAYTDVSKLHHAEVMIKLGKTDQAKITLLSISNEFKHDRQKLSVVMSLLVSMKDKSGIASKSSRYGSNSSKDMQAGEIISGSESLSKSYIELIKNSNKPPEYAFDSILIITYGRTGSTLLQGMLNSLDGVTILGENDNAFNHLFLYQKSIENLTKRIYAQTPSSPFFGADLVSSRSSLKNIRQLIKDYFERVTSEKCATCIGFKEVKYAENSETFIEYLEFLKKTFPNPAFVFLWRDHDEVLKSGWWKTEDKVEKGRLLKEMESKALVFAEDKKCCFFVDYEDVKNISSNLKGLFSFLGAKFDRDKLEKIKSFPHSYNPEEKLIRDLFLNQKLGSPLVEQRALSD